MYKKIKVVDMMKRFEIGFAIVLFVCVSRLGDIKKIKVVDMHDVQIANQRFRFISNAHARVAHALKISVIMITR